MIFVIRLLFVLVCRTAESPDEWWQSYEVAYRLVFGKGQLSWEWHEGIRSVMFPAFYALPMYVLKLLRCDTAPVLWVVIRAQQACVLAAIDACILALAARFDDAIVADVRAQGKKADRAERSIASRKAAGCHPLQEVRRAMTLRSVEGYAVRIALIQWYLLYTGSRAYSNVAEALLVLLAFLQDSRFSFLLFAGLACGIRVTSVFALIPIFAGHVVWHTRRRGLRGLLGTVFLGVVMAALILAFVVGIDYIFYQRWIFTIYEFLYHNIILNVSQYYGTHSWHWYFTGSLPLMFGIHIGVLALLPLVLRRLNAGPNVRRVVWQSAGLMVWIMACHSFVMHKETRFIYSVLPFCIVLAAFVLSCFATYPERLRFFWRGIVNGNTVMLLHWVAVALNVFFIVFVGLIYRKGSLTMVEVVRNAPLHFDRLDAVTACYFTPGYSHMHGKVGVYSQVDCSMKLDPETQKPVPTEADIYRGYPARYVWWKYARTAYTGASLGSKEDRVWFQKAERLLPKSEAPYPLPDAMVLFRNVATELQEDFLEPRGYVLYKRVLHSVVNFEPDEDAELDLWVRKHVLESAGVKQN